MDNGNRELSHDFLSLFEEYHEAVYAYAFRLTGSAVDGEDVTQQTFLTAQAKLDQLRERSAAKSWLFTIARNIYLKGLRDRGTKPVSIELVAEPTQPVDPDLTLDSDELQSFLNELPEEFRVPLVLFYFQDFSYKEIAAQLDVPMGTVMSRLARAKTMLRRRLTPSESPTTQ